MPKVYSDLELNGNFTYDNNPSDGYILTTDSSGLVSWTSSTSVIATASSTDFGIMKIGNTLNINEFGVTNIGTASETVLGGFLVGSGVTMSSDGRLSVKTDLGNVLYVSENGNDSTGEKGNLHRPYQTLYAAKTGATAGDVIHVFPQTIVYDNRDSASNQWNGRQNEINLWKDGVTYYFEAGSKIEIYNVSPSGQALYLFGKNDNIDENCTVLGHLEYEQFADGPDSSNGQTRFFNGGDGVDDGYTFYCEMKKLTSHHCEVINIIKSNTSTNPINFTIKLEEEYFDYVSGNVSSGAFYFLRGLGSDSTIKFNSYCRNRKYVNVNSNGYNFYFRQQFSNSSSINITGETCISLYRELIHHRYLIHKDVNISIDKIYVNYGYNIYKKATILTTHDNWTSNFVLNVIGDIYDYNDGSILNYSDLFYVTCANSVINYKGNIYTRSIAGGGKSIVNCGVYAFGNGTSYNMKINIDANIYHLGTSSTTAILFRSYGTNTIINYTGNITGDFKSLCNINAGGSININNSNIESSATSSCVLSSLSGTTPGNIKFNNSYVKLSSGGSISDGKYTRMMVNNSSIINSGTGSVFSNSTNIGDLQLLNSSLYTSGTSSISYGTSSVISSNTVVNATYSIPNLYGDITTLTNIII